MLKMKLQYFGHLILKRQLTGKDPDAGKVREGNGTQLQYSRLENPMDRGAWGPQSMGSLRVGHD